MNYIEDTIKAQADPGFVGPPRPLRVIHNHGAMLLRDWKIEGDYAKGIVFGGGLESRILQYRSFRPFPVNVGGEWPIYDRRISAEYKSPFLRVDCCFC